MSEFDDVFEEFFDDVKATLKATLKTWVLWLEAGLTVTIADLEELLTVLEEFEPPPPPLSL